MEAERAPVLRDFEEKLSLLKERRPVLIAGPTASGKSALALELAERVAGTVINADSMQVYAELRILTARPTEVEEARVLHRLYGHVPIRDGYSVGRWLSDVELAIEEAMASRRVPIVVGGTGMYFKALTQGLSPIPEIPAEIREPIRRRLAEEGAEALYAELSARDPDAAERLPPSDPHRILRALEVHEATGRPISEWQRQSPGPALIDPATAAKLVLWPDRDRLRARIDERVDVMLAAGALEEARAVMEMELDHDLPGYRAHGLRPLIAHLRGELTLEQAAEKTRAETRQYAKRQFTWFRHQMDGWERMAPPWQSDP
ncbi:tRNA (adenosine(37)-N6)-dimethylallyltransferase MiaA [Microbaculum marinum]|uniref:tRNA dimethylallyltransferase n=1 Tax=Microbaculum marinum TaxID=1764581 RepID=A0AAW9RKS1_9HYPH